MTTALDAKLGPKVLAVIAKVGVSATIIVEQNTAKPAVVDADVTRVEYAVTVSPPQFEEGLGESTIYRKGSAILAGYGLTFTPSPGNILRHASREYRVIGTKPIRSGDAVVAYSLTLER